MTSKNLVGSVDMDTLIKAFVLIHAEIQAATGCTFKGKSIEGETARFDNFFLPSGVRLKVETALSFLQAGNIEASWDTLKEASTHLEMAQRSVFRTKLMGFSEDLQRFQQQKFEPSVYNRLHNRLDEILRVWDVRGASRPSADQLDLWYIELSQLTKDVEAEQSRIMASRRKKDADAKARTAESARKAKLAEEQKKIAESANQVAKLFGLAG